MTLESIEVLRARRPHAPTEGVPEALGLRSFDWALPQLWVDDVHERTGVWPQTLGFVWSYDQALWGAPVPLTVEAEQLLAQYKGGSR